MKNCVNDLWLGTAARDLGPLARSPVFAQAVRNFSGKAFVGVRVFASMLLGKGSLLVSGRSFLGWELVNVLQ